MIEITYKHNLSGSWERPVITDENGEKVWFSSYSIKPYSTIYYRGAKGQGEFRLRRYKIKTGEGEKTNVFPIEIKGNGVLEILVGK